MRPEAQTIRGIQAFGVGVTLGVVILWLVLAVPALINHFGVVVGVVAALGALGVGVEEFARWRRRYRHSRV